MRDDHAFACSGTWCVSACVSAGVCVCGACAHSLSSVYPAALKADSSSSSFSFSLVGTTAVMMSACVGCRSHVTLLCTNKILFNSTVLSWYKYPCVFKQNHTNPSSSNC